AQCYVESNYAFTGYTYGLGSVESYGYNIGLMVDSLNLQSVRYNTITGHAFYDANANSIKDATEPFYKPAKVNVMRGTDTFSIITPSGYFETFVDTGTYHSRLATLSPYHTVVPVQDTSSFSSYFNIDTVVFAVQPIPGKRDMFVNLFPISPARPGFRVKYKLVYGNKGTDTADVTITLVKASKLNFDSASVAPAYAVADTLRWNFTALKPGDGGAVTIYFTSHTPPALNQNDTLVSVATITSGATDETPADNISTLRQRVTGSYDPNDKKEIHDGRMLGSSIAAGEKLQYTIRFQNTGSDTAFNIFIKDTLDTKLDWNSLQMISASHDYQLSVKNGVCTWIFNDILLVDSNRNEPMSHGYVSFEINARETVVAGDVIQNRASIYFDHNLPIVTNTDNTSIVTAVFPVKLLSFTATKREGDNLLKWRVAQQSQFSHFELERSDNGRDFTRIATMAGGPEEFSYADNKFPRSMNYYRLRMVDVDGSYTYSPVRKINNTGAMDVTVYPNPATNLIQVRVESIVPKALDLQVLSADGRVVITGKIAIGAGSTIVPVNTAALAKGVYMLRLAAPDEAPVTIRFQKQ
ncbi:MAG: repeat domain in Vibrio, Colwellia, Bradyrhizobium and Shewanella, partial [Chitinophagaceae bacterium]|nr:repeat domain in Vibrio, Colwellia, Bradyrhizobium and Shewanella [Chitinophagaceae bacterium]